MTNLGIMKVSLDTVKLLWEVTTNAEFTKNLYTKTIKKVK